MDATTATKVQELLAKRAEIDKQITQLRDQAKAELKAMFSKRKKKPNA
jgi:hypothetical protein